MSLPEASRERSCGVALLAEVLGRSGTARVRVQGSSMVPAIRPGDQAKIDSHSFEQLRSGDVVAFSREDRLFVHRLIELCADGRLLTRGDALPSPDAPVCRDEFLGKVTEIERQGALVPIKSSLLQSAAAALFRRSQLCSALFVKFASL